MRTDLDHYRPETAPPVPWRAYRLVWVIGAVGAVLSLTLAGWFAREARRLDTARFFELGYAIGVGLERRVEGIEALLRNVQRILNARATPDQQEWDEFMNQTSPQWNQVGVLAIGYATNAQAVQTIALLDGWLRPDSPRPREEFYTMPAELLGKKSWSVWLADLYREELRPLVPFASEHEVRSREKGEFHARRYGHSVEPVAVEGPGLAFQDFGGRMRIIEHAAGEEVLLHAIYRDDVKITRGEEVLRRGDGSPVRGVTMLVPTYHPRRAEFWRALEPEKDWRAESHWLRWNLNTGFVFAHLDLAEMLREAQGPGEPAVRVEIHSAYDDEHKPGMVGRASWLNPDGHPLRAADRSFQPAYQHTHLWRMYGGRWTLFFHTTPLFDRQSTRYRAWWAGGWGLLTTGLVCWVLGLQVRGRWLEASRAARLRVARDALQAAQEERERLAHDLHDGAVQSLYAVQLGLTRTAQEISRAAPAAGAGLGQSRANLESVIAELRAFLGQLRAEPEAGVSSEFVAVVKSIVARLRPASRAAIEVDCDAAVAGRLGSGQALQLAAVVREALSNSLRHADARRITVRLAAEGQTAVLEVRDDGRGFDPRQPIHGLGLKSLRRRAELLRGRLDLESAPGKGTLVRLRLNPERAATPPPGARREANGDNAGANRHADVMRPPP
ncbi:MAG: sensor histidine kinase [Verrucomicrobia bacterium]|nr:sensor histidine kinase [Verrucomicrobiota bacterium]